MILPLNVWRSNPCRLSMQDTVAGWLEGAYAAVQGQSAGEGAPEEARCQGNDAKGEHLPFPP